MSRIKVQDHPDYARDPVSGAIVNVNTAAYRNAVNAARKMRDKDEKMESLLSDINKLQREFEKLRKLIQEGPNNK